MTKAEREKEDGWENGRATTILPKSITKTLLHVHCHALRELNPDHRKERERARGKNPFAAMTSRSPDSGHHVELPCLALELSNHVSKPINNRSTGYLTGFAVK